MPRYFLQAKYNVYKLKILERADDGYSAQVYINFHNFFTCQFM